MLDKIKLQKDILKDLESVTMDYYNQTGEKIVMHPLAPDIMTTEINTKIDVIRSMNYFDREINQNIKVTGLEAIVKAFSKEIIYHFQNSFGLNDLTDVTITTPINGDIIAYVNGEWKNTRNTSTTTIINEDGEEEEVVQTVPVHNHGIGIVNRLAKFRDSVTGNLISSTITETPLDVSTSLNLRIGGYLEVSDVEHLTTVSDRVLVHNNNRIYYRSVTELINDIVVESHNHNDLYYLKTQLQNSGQSQIHYNNLTNVPTTFNPTNHASNHLYGGSDAIFPAHSQGFFYNNGSGTLSWTTISVESLGLDEIFAPIIHIHATSDITSGTLGVARGGTGSNNFTAGYLKANGTNAFSTVSTIPWSDLTSVPSTFTPSNHALISSHTVSGLTSGHFLKATGATSFGFAVHGLTYSDVGAQPLDATLTALAALNTSIGFVYQTGSDTFTKYGFGGTGSATTVSRSDHTHSGYETTISSGLTTQYWRGDKSWQVLNTSIVPEVINLYYTDNRVQTFGDGRYTQINSVFGSLTSGYVPYYNGSSFVNSPLSVSGANVLASGYIYATDSLRTGTLTTGLLEITPYLFGYGQNFKSFTIKHDNTLLLDVSKIGTSFDSYWTGTFHATSFIRGNYTVWDSGNDGSGSGLDADTLDTYHASSFSLSNHNHSILTLGTGLSGTSYDGSSAVTAAVSYGSSSGTACQGNDSRLLSTTQLTDLTDGDDSTLHYHSSDRSAVYSGLTSGYIPYYNGSAFANSVLSQANSQLCSSSNINLGNQNDPSTDQGNVWITWGYRSDLSPYYAIRTDRHVYNIENQNRLQIGWHTGVEIGASSIFGGTRFFNNSPFIGTQIMSIGDGDNHVRISNSLYVNSNVGIGTTTLTEKLNVAGSIYASSSVYGGYGCYAYNPTANGTYIGVFKYQGALPGHPVAYYTVLKTDNSYIYFSAGGKYSGHIGGSDAEFGLLNTTGNVKVSINTNGNSFLMGGNVGINVTSPIYKLHVDGSFYATSMSRSGNTVWDAGNDGAGSGLDADTLDTYHGSNYLGKNGNTHYQADVWVQFSGTQGLYFPNSGSCTNLYPITDNYNYGSLLIEGSRGGWQGISFYSTLRPNNLPTFMISNANYSHGMHVQGATPHQWLWYYDASVNNILIQGDNAKFVWHGGNLTGTRNEHTHTNISNADTIDGLHAESFFNNMGATHSSYHSFDTLPAFGCRFLQGSINGPIASQTDYYGVTIGLGSDYDIESYASQLYWKRNSASYLYMRFREGGVWGSWYKVGAGYADDATHAYNSDALSNLTIGNATANRLVRYNSNATQFVSSLIVDDGTNLGMYSNGYAAMMAGANIGIFADVNEGGIGLVGDVVTDLTMANGTYTKIHNAKIDYGAYNTITGAYQVVTTVNLAAYSTHRFLIDSYGSNKGEAYYAFVGCKVGTIIFVSNSNGQKCYIMAKSDSISFKPEIFPNQTLMLFCEQTDESTYWIWRVFQSLVVGNEGG